MFSVFDKVAKDSREVRRLKKHYLHGGFQNQVIVDLLLISLIIDMQSQEVFQLCNDSFVTTVSTDVTWTFIAITKLGQSCKEK